MDNATHTPGPWFAECGAAHNTVWAKDGIACLATIHHGVEPAGLGDANARLIAAAPDLLKALENAAFALESAIMLQGLKELEPYASAARDAIAKARGN